MRINDKPLLARLNKVMQQTDNFDESHLQRIISEVQDIFSKSKDYYILLSQIHRLEYLNIENWLFHNIKIFMQYSEILCQTTELVSENNLKNLLSPWITTFKGL